jgi:hypothetical protein
VQVTVDTAAAPQAAAWGRQAKKLVEKWHPLIADLLKSEGFTPPAEVKIIFRKDKKFVAYTNGTTITISADWIAHHPEDYGMVIHELTHVIQRYPPSNNGWLVEGIADYIRFFHFEPKTRLGPIDPTRASYRDGYRTTARFLAWVQKRYDKDLVSKLNAALRGSRYDTSLFEKYTSKNLDQLWAEFIRSANKR